MGEWLGNWRKKKKTKNLGGNPDGEKKNWEKKTGKKSKAGRLETRSGKDLSPQF